MKAIKLYFVFCLVFFQSFTTVPQVQGNVMERKYERHTQIEKKTKTFLTTTRFAELSRELGKKESGSNWRAYSKAKNKKGQIIKAIGKYQFMPIALKQIGFGHITYDEFVKNPNIFPEKDQEIAMQRCLAFNRKVLSKHIDKYAGTVINGISITEKGILAMAHLAGAGGTMKFLDSHGHVNPKDANGTHASDYLKKFN